MNANTFLEAALPSEGLLCAVGIREGTTRHTFVNGVDALIEAAKDFNATGHDAYFACNSFTVGRRLQNLVHTCRSFYLDIDCGEAKFKKGKGYLTKADAIAALKDFCKSLSLPKPFIIDSGRGLHVYWLLEDGVPRDQWQPVARALKKAALTNKLIIDAAVTADSSRVLRVPGTLNYKDKESPKNVIVLTQGKIVTLDSMKDTLAAYVTVDEPVVRRELDAVSKALMGNYEHNFNLIARKSIKGSGCAQIKHALAYAATLEEPLWHAALSVAVRCVDGDEAIHKISKNYPGYSPEETEKKAHATGGPRTCAWYRVESGVGAVCEGCPHKITSPIQLGRLAIVGSNTIPEEKVKAPIVPAELFNSPPVVEETTDITLIEPEAEEPEEVAEQKMPEIPYPYFRGASGGIFKTETGPDGEPATRQIFDDDLYVTKRVVDPTDGICAVLRLHSPHDPTCEFSVPLKHMQTPDKFRDIMSEKGIVATQKGMADLMAYTTSFVKSLRTKMQADKARTQFGWADRDTKFILGTREISAKGIAYSPASTVTAHLAKFMEPTGSADVWREAFNMYNGKAGAEATVFAMLASFGSPLLKIAGMSGMMLSLVNTTSGTGKTSALRLINSVWGHPDELMQIQKDTAMAKQGRMGVMNNLPNCFDEMTNEKPEVLSDMVYGISQGRGRNRMRADANIERVNETRWNTFGIGSTNAFIVDKLAANKSTSDGEMMRVLEFKVDLVEVAGAHELMNALANNYGHAGGQYAQALVKYRTSLTGWIDKCRKGLWKKAGGINKERFWFTGAACTFVGAHIAQQLGLIDYNLEHLQDWFVQEVGRQRKTVSNHIVHASDLLGEYLLENYGGTLVVNDDKLNPVSLTNVFKQANTKITARFEIGFNRLYVPKKDFKEYCVRRQGDLDSVLFSSNKDYTYITTVKKRLAAGTGLISPAIDAYEFTINEELAMQLKIGGAGAELEL